MIEHVAVSATCFFVDKAREKTWYFKSLSNRIGEDQFPASKMKWGIFLGMDTVNAPQQIFKIAEATTAAF